MNYRYDDELFEIARELFRKECYAPLAIGEEYGSKLFPHMRTLQKSGSKMHKLYFNDRVEVVLSLYNLAIAKGINIGTALSYYLLFYECLTLDEYDHASTFLKLFSEEVKRLQLKQIMEDMKHKTNGYIRYQVLFTIFHEISHEYYRKYEESHATATATSKKVMDAIKVTYTEISTKNYNVKNIKKKDVRNYILSQIPKGCSDDERRRIVMENVEFYYYLTELSNYIDLLINDMDKQFLDELSCDRYAITSFMPWAERNLLPPEHITILQGILYVVVNAMDNVKVLQNYCNPPRGANERLYDPRQIVLRQRALIINFMLLEDYINDNFWFLENHTYKDLNDRFTKLNTILEEVMTTALNTMKSHERLIGEIQKRRGEIKPSNGTTVYCLSSDMEDIVAELTRKNKVTCPLDGIPMNICEFTNYDSLSDLRNKYFNMIRTWRYKI